jgi:hypothetical protein
MTQSNLLYAFAPYHGEFTPAKLVFNANLQEFAQKVNFIVALETGGKISTQAAYEQIAAVQAILDRSRQQLDLN